MSEQIKTDFLTTQEVAELLRVKQRKVYDLVSREQIPCSRVTGKLLFPRDEILAMIEQQSQSVAPCRAGQVRERGGCCDRFTRV